ncbi:FAD-dependent oxidoreductase [Streptomyces sp. NPDC021224]|uniref:FAD-dependent oxidoreductase n=1 Tax=unclassified Streptomyces TaxID=2593676 RepID=UPI0037A48D55
MTSSPPPRVHADVAVIGGGLGGVAAALAACAAGRTVVLTTDQDVLGGQITSQLVPALDEHPHVERGGISASYRGLREALRARYGGVANPGGGWVSRLCFEPAAARAVLADLLAPHVRAGRLTVLTGLRPAAVVREADVVGEVRLEAVQGPGHDVTVAAEVFCDATETGALLPQAGADWVVGSEGTEAYGESLALPGGPRPHAVQSCTVGFAVEHRPGEDHTVPRPQGYSRWRDGQPFTLEIAGWDDRRHRYRMFTEGPDGHPPFWTYRRLRDGGVLGGPDIALINWSGNDYADASLVHEPRRATEEARALSLAFLHWLQTECPRDDGSGFGYPGLRLSPEAAGTPDGLAAEPYVRESRRLASARPVREQDLLPVPGRARAANMPDSCGLASYHMDLHARVGHPGSAYAPTAPFQIPLSALVGSQPVNLVAAAKNLAATQVAAAAYRVHHGEWAVGEAAGTLAANAVRRGLTPLRAATDPAARVGVQQDLVRAGVPLAWLLDVPPEHPVFAHAHLLAAAGGLAGERLATLEAQLGRPVDEADAAALTGAAGRLAPGLEPPAVAVGSAWPDAVTALGTAVHRALDVSTAR